MRGRVTVALALLVAGLPLALSATTSVTLEVLAWTPTYQTALKLTTSVTVLAVTGLALWIGFALEKRNRGAGALVQAASVLTAVTALLFVLAGTGSTGSVGVPPPTVINASSQTVVVLSGPQGNLRHWRTLAPGERAIGDGPFLSTSGCYPNMGLEARTTDGRVIGTLPTFCARDIWRITDTGAERTSDDR